MTPAVRRLSGPDQAIGAGFVLLSTLAWSCSGLFTRMLTTDVFTAITWRSFFGGVFLLIPFCGVRRSMAWRALAIGWPGAALVASLALCSAFTIGAFYLTTIANAAVIYATTPFMTALLLLLLRGERIRPRTTVACIGSFAGVVIIVAGGVGTGSLVGNVLALGMTLTFSFVIVLPRMFPEIDTIAATILGAFAAMLAFLPFSHAQEMPEQDWVVLALFGFTNFTLALFFFLAGVRRVGGPQAALIGTLDVVMAPLWVWLVFKERPATATFMGGGLILAVVIWHAVLEWLSDRTSEAGARP